MEKCKNVFEAILKYGHDEDYLPDPTPDFCPTDAAAGSEAHPAALGNLTGGPGPNGVPRGVAEVGRSQSARRRR